MMKTAHLGFTERIGTSTADASPPAAKKSITSPIASGAAAAT